MALRRGALRHTPAHLQRWLGRHLFRTTLTVGGVLAAATYVAMNVAAMFMFPGSRGLAVNFGYLACCQAIIVVLLATKNAPLHLLLGLEFDSTIWFHRFAGQLLVLAASLHVFLTWDQWIRYGMTTSRTLDTTKYIFGLVAWAALLAMLVTSLRWVRRQSWELFKYSHYLFFVFLGLTLAHTPKQGSPYIAVALAAVVADAIMRMLGVVSVPTKASSVKVVGDVVHVEFPSVSKWWRRYVERRGGGAPDLIVLTLLSYLPPSHPPPPASTQAKWCGCASRKSRSTSGTRLQCRPASTTR